MVERLNSLSDEQLSRIFSLAEEMQEEEGTYVAPKNAAQQEWSFANGFDLMPLVISGDEWSRLEAGVLQRVRAWNFFLRDIYTGQEILKAGVVPYDIVYADPNFHRGCARLPCATPNYLQLTAFDLRQDSRGHWIVVEDHLGVAEGASYALKKRQAMKQVAPHLFDGLDIWPIDDFATQVMDVLRAQVPKSSDRVRGVLLAQGSKDEHYLDHATLARQMGVSIVQGTDLVVLDSRLYLKTITGMDRVDVVLRRMATSMLDPVTFDPRSRYGVPGMLSCVRKGELAMANGMGSDLADNRALAAHLPAIMEYYTGEKPILPSIHILELGDLDIREEVADHRDDYIVRHVWKRGPAFEWPLRHMPEGEWDAFWRAVESAPHEYVAHKALVPSAYPVRTAAGAQSLPLTLRAFGLGQNRISPCALAWTGGGATPSVSIEQTTDRIKDVWLFRHASAPSVSVYAHAEEAPTRLRLTSRVAEAFFWMGRYAERAEATTRILRIVQTLAWPTSDTEIARQRRPLWAAMAATSGRDPDFFVAPEKKERPVPLQELPFHFLLDVEHRSSVVSSLLGCRENAENIREHFPPEVWSVLNRLYLQLAFRAEQVGTEELRLALEDRSIHQEILTQLDELTGALEKHMLHNDAWHFWQLGVYAERGLKTLITLQQVVAPESAGPGRHSASSTNLDLLLQMLAGQYAYRSLYHARPVAARVARLLLQDEDFPRSALFCLRGMRRALEATLGEHPARGADTPLKHCARMILELNQIDMPDYFPRTGQSDSIFSRDDNLSNVPRPEFSAKLEELVDLLVEFNLLISDHYLDHQVAIREPELFDLGAG